MKTTVLEHKEESMAHPEMSPVMRETVKRYLEIQKQERKIKKEKRELQQRLAVMCKSSKQRLWPVEIGGRVVVVTYWYSQSVECEEEVLKERLGERYLHICQVVPALVNKYQEAAGPLLAPIADYVCRPHPNAIMKAIADGHVTRTELRDLVKRHKRDHIRVGSKYDRDRVEAARAA
jgi:hypothetical protein